MIDLAAGEQTARGRLQAIGTDFVVVTTRDRRLCLVATTAIVALRAVDASGARGAAGDRLAPLGTSLVDALALLAAERLPSHARKAHPPPPDSRGQAVPQAAHLAAAFR